MAIILGLESSCDETAAAIVRSDRTILSHALAGQEDHHRAFGGVVPEIAARAHAELMTPLVETALADAGLSLNDIDAIAATAGPGLIGALLVGVSAAKSLALVWDKPFVGVNHLEAHLYAGLLDDPTLQFPLVVLLVSGGHTMIIEMRGHGDYVIMGRTIDDAAGEAYDKVARYLQLGYPGGPAIDKIAPNGNPHAVEFPRAMMHDGLDVSFSGLKTSVINYVKKNPGVDNIDIAASFQAAVVDVLCAKTIRAAQKVGAKGIVLGGGVSANSLLRSEMTARGAAAGFTVALPSRDMCTDNAAMIAAAAWHRLASDGPTSLSCGAYPNLKLDAVPR